MSWWNLLIGRGDPGPASPEVVFRRLSLPGWTLVQCGDYDAAWRDPLGDAITLTATEKVRIEPRLLTDPLSLQQRCRSWAEAAHGGLIEAGPVKGSQGSGYAFIYKKLSKPAFTFTGMLLLPRMRGSWVWAVVCIERGVTGVREAMVTTELVNAGKLTMESYESSWARDPYDPNYRGVDHSALRYISDAEEYDALFPAHPLSKARRLLRTLLAFELGGANR